MGHVAVFSALHLPGGIQRECIPDFLLIVFGNLQCYVTVSMLCTTCGMRTFGIVEKRFCLNIGLRRNQINDNMLVISPPISKVYNVKQHSKAD